MSREDEHRRGRAKDNQPPKKSGRGGDGHGGVDGRASGDVRERAKAAGPSDDARLVNKNGRTAAVQDRGHGTKDHPRHKHGHSGRERHHSKDQTIRERNGGKDCSSGEPQADGPPPLERRKDERSNRDHKGAGDGHSKDHKDRQVGKDGYSGRDRHKSKDGRKDRHASRDGKVAKASRSSVLLPFHPFYSGLILNGVLSCPFLDSYFRTHGP